MTEWRNLASFLGLRYWPDGTWGIGAHRGPMGPPMDTDKGDKPTIGQYLGIEARPDGSFKPGRAKNPRSENVEEELEDREDPD